MMKLFFTRNALIERKEEKKNELHPLERS
jgi:hypothetical protein